MDQEQRERGNLTLIPASCLCLPLTSPQQRPKDTHRQLSIMHCNNDEWDHYISAPLAACIVSCTPVSNSQHRPPECTPAACLTLYQAGACIEHCCGLLVVFHACHWLLLLSLTTLCLTARTQCNSYTLLGRSSCSHLSSPRFSWLCTARGPVNVSSLRTPRNMLQHVHTSCLSLQLLGLKAGQSYKDSTINQMYDELMSTPMEAGYSQQTVTARCDLLASTLSDIICNKGKKMGREVILPYELIPGALAILAEVRGLSRNAWATYRVCDR